MIERRKLKLTRAQSDHVQASGGLRADSGIIRVELDASGEVTIWYAEELATGLVDSLVASLLSAVPPDEPASR